MGGDAKLFYKRALFAKAHTPEINRYFFSLVDAFSAASGGSSGLATALAQGAKTQQGDGQSNGVATANANALAIPVPGTILYVGGKTQGFTGTLSPTSISLSGLSGGVDNTLIEGDLVVVYYGVAANALVDTTVNSDFVQLPKIGDGALYFTNLAVAHKFMGAIPDASFEVSQTFGIAYAGIVAVLVFRGVDQSMPLDVAPTSATGVGILINPPGVTPAYGKTLLVAGGVSANNRGAGQTYSSSDLDSIVTGSANDNYDAMVGVGIKAISDPTDPAVFTSITPDNGNFRWAAYSLVLRPAGGGVASSYGVASGVAAANADGGIVKPASWSANGAAGAAAVGAKIQQGAGSANGVALVDVIGRSIAVAIGSVLGNSATSGVGRVIKEARGTASGLAMAAADGLFVVASVGASYGLSTADSDGALIAPSIGVSNGLAQAFAVSDVRVQTPAKRTVTVAFQDRVAATKAHNRTVSTEAQLRSVSA